MEPLLNPKIISSTQDWIKKYTTRIKQSFTILSLFQKAVLCLLVINLIFTHAALEASQEATDASYNASSNAEDAYSAASQAERASENTEGICERITRY